MIGFLSGFDCACGWRGGGVSTLVVRMQKQLPSLVVMDISVNALNRAKNTLCAFGGSPLKLGYY